MFEHHLDQCRQLRCAEVVAQQETLQALGAEHLAIEVLRLGQAVRVGIDHVAGLQGAVACAGSELIVAEHPERHAVRGDLLVGAGTLTQHEDGWQSPVPDVQSASIGRQFEQHGTAEIADRQQLVELSVEFSGDRVHRQALGRHREKHRRRGQGAERGRQPVAREVAEEHIDLPMRSACRLDQVARQAAHRLVPGMHPGQLVIAAECQLAKHVLGQPLLLQDHVLLLSEHRVLVLEGRVARGQFLHQPFRAERRVHAVVQ